MGQADANRVEGGPITDASTLDPWPEAVGPGCTSGPAPLVTAVAPGYSRVRLPQRHNSTELGFRQW